MDILYLLIPLGIVLLGIAVWAFMWAVRSGQFDDLEGPAHRILMDDDERPHGNVIREDNSDDHKDETDNPLPDQDK